MKDREVISAKRDAITVSNESSKLTQRIEQLNNALKSKQNDNVNLMRQIEDVKLQVNSYKSEARQLQNDLDLEKRSRLVEIQRIEEESKKKFNQLKYLVDQYKDQMSEYQKLASENQEIILGKLSGSGAGIGSLSQQKRASSAVRFSQQPAQPYPNLRKQVDVINGQG